MNSTRYPCPECGALPDQMHGQKCPIAILHSEANEFLDQYLVSADHRIIREFGATFEPWI